MHSPGLAAHHSSQYDPSSLIHIQNAAPLAAANVDSSKTTSSTCESPSALFLHRISPVSSMILAMRMSGMLLTTSCRTLAKWGSVAASPETSTRNGRSECIYTFTERLACSATCSRRWSRIESQKSWGFSHSFDLSSPYLGSMVLRWLSHELK